MSKVADYYITGVWKDNHERITSVMLHLVNNDNSFNPKGIKTSKDEAIRLLKNNKSILTLTWGYKGWNRGAHVSYEVINNQEYLRSVPNTKREDNLDNSFPFHLFI